MNRRPQTGKGSTPTSPSIYAERNGFSARSKKSSIILRNVSPLHNVHMRFEATKQILLKLPTLEKALILEVFDKGPVFRGLRKPPLKHSVGIIVPGLQLKPAHYNHLLPGQEARLHYIAPGRNWKGGAR